MKKDLTKYYVEVTPEDAKKVAKITYSQFVSEKTIRRCIERGDNIMYANDGVFLLGHRNLNRKKISLKTLTNYITYNKQVEQSFNEPKELRKLTEEKSFLSKENQSLKNIVSKQNVVNNLLNDKINQQDETIKKLESKILAKDIVMAILAFVLTISFIVITQKM